MSEKRPVYISPNHKKAAVTLYGIVALNEDSLLNRAEVAQVLEDTVELSSDRTPRAWLTGNFQEYSLRHEHFLRIIKKYRGGIWLETNQNIIDLAINLYGADYQRAISLIEIWPEDIDTKELDFRQKLNGLIARKNADSAAIESVAAYFGSNWKAMSVAVNMVESELIDWRSLEEELKQYAFSEQGKDVNLILYAIVDIALSYLSPAEKFTFTKIGSLPQLAYYDFAIFKALWELPDGQVLECLMRFQSLGLITKTDEQMWEIDKDMLHVTAQDFLKLPEREQSQAHGWAKRRLQTDSFHKILRKRVVVEFSDFPKITDLKETKRQRKVLGVNNFIGMGLRKRALKNLSTLGYYDSDWEALQLFTALMRPIDYLTAYYLHSQWTVYLIFAGMIAMSLTVMLLLWSFPAWRLFGVFLFSASIFITILKMYKIEEQWVRLWKIIVPKIVAQKDEEGL